MKLLILGGGGFLGSWICDRLLIDGHELRVFERPRIGPYRRFAAHESVEWMTGDFASSSDMSAALRGMDGVVHLISTTLPRNSNDDPIYDVQSNVISSLQLLDAMHEQGIRRIVFISSGGTVYGIPETTPLDERHPTNPICSYGITKLMIEKYLLMRAKLSGLQPVILRVTNPYGPRQRTETAQGAVAAFTHKILSRQPIDVWGDGSVTRDYLYVADVADAFALAVTHDGPDRVLNISSGAGVSVLQLIEAIASAAGCEPTVRHLPARPFDVPANVLNNSLARDSLRWTPRVCLTDGVRQMIEWARQSIHG